MLVFKGGWLSFLWQDICQFPLFVKVTFNGQEIQYTPKRFISFLQKQHSGFIGF